MTTHKGLKNSSPFHMGCGSMIYENINQKNKNIQKLRGEDFYNLNWIIVAGSCPILIHFQDFPRKVGR